MEMIVNTSGVPVNTTKPMLDRSMFGGTTKQLTVTPTRYGHFVAVQFDDTLKYLNKRDSLCL
jgi:hypothetical protein